MSNPTPVSRSSPTHMVGVDGGEVPAFAQGPDDPSQVPGLVVVHSIFGPAPDLLQRMAELANAAFVVVADPFWRVGGGVVPYHNPDAAFGRLEGFDLELCLSDMRAVIDWTRARCNGQVAGLGICFGGPIVLVANEVGLGIVPDNALAREFRDHAGRLNQAVAGVADRVIFITAGLPMTLK